MSANQRRFSLSVASALLLALAACGRAPAPAVDARPAEDGLVQQLFDFESQPPSLVTEMATATSVDGALEVEFMADAYWSSVRLRPAEPWDWSELSDFHLALDVTNTGERSAQLYVSLTNADDDIAVIQDVRDATGNWTSSIAPGESATLFLVLDGPASKLVTGRRENPPPWDTDEVMMQWRYGKRPIDLANVTGIGFGARGYITAKQLRIDNIRLRENPPHDLSFLAGVVDEFGQNANVDFPIKVHTLEELRQAADEELAELTDAGLLPDRSRWSGWKDGPQLEATGYFRVEKVDGKWWMVDPDGFLFFSHGVANVRMANLSTFTGIDFKDSSVRQVDLSEVTPEDSIGVVDIGAAARETRFVSYDLRHKMFAWLPEYSDPLAKHYSFRRSANMGAMNGGETYNFYRANLERRYGETEPESYLRKWEQVTLDRMNAWGFTSFGNWVDPAFYANEQVPYFANGWIIGDYASLSSQAAVSAPIPDPFDPEFVRRADVTIAVIADEIQGSPWCVGVFVDNEKRWGLREGSAEERYGIILDGLSKSAEESPAKTVFTRMLRDKYTTIDALNGAWETAFGSWQELAAGAIFTHHNDALMTDLSNMLAALSNEYFRVVHDSLEKYLPNHLYMGARMASWGMPPETVEAAVRYSDVLSFNIYEEGFRQQAWSFLEDVDLPTVIGEFHIGTVSDTGLFHGGLVQAANQADRAAMYRAYMDSVAASDMMVGAHWFQYVDSPLTGRSIDGEGYNVGFVAVTDRPYPEMVEAAKAFGAELYPQRFGREL